MISRNRNNAPVPDSLLSNECKMNLANLIDDILSGNAIRIKRGKDSISADYYRGNKDENGTTVQDVVIALKAIYGEKCAFCESQRSRPDVEHFRPKKGVVGIPKVEHQGYYWLCYEWTNLVPSCPDCNDAKGNYFPIKNEGSRVYGPTFKINGRSICEAEMSFDIAPLVLEEPLLLHPGFNKNCDSYFTFNNKGEIFGADNDGIGNLNREKFDLDRKDLRYYRQKEIDNFVEKLEMALCFPEDNLFIGVLNKLRARGLDLDQEYTAMCKYAYNHFDEFFVPLLPIPAQHRAEEIYFNNRNPI